MPGWKRWLPLIAVIGLSAALLIPLRIVFSHDRGVAFAGASQSTDRAVAVTCVQMRNADPGFCQRMGADLVSRDPLTEAQRADADLRAAPITDAIRDRARRNAWCEPMPPAPPNGPQAPCREVFAPARVEDVRAALAQTGYREAIVRIARDDDPAPLESLFYAVPVADACLLGYLTSNDTQWRIVGRLPDGTCLNT